MENKKVAVVMLPTEHSHIWIDDKKNLHFGAPNYGNYRLEEAACQHLYFTHIRDENKPHPDDTPKMFDWYIDDTNQVRECLITDADYWATRKTYRKIIAASPNLKLTSVVPLIPSDWIRNKYVPSNGGINEVRLEVNYYTESGKNNISEQSVLKITLTANNEVVIVEEPTPDEIGQIIKKDYEAGNIQIKVVDTELLVDIELEEAAMKKYPYPDDISSTVSRNKLKIIIDKERSIWLNGANFQKERSGSWTTEQMLQAIKYGFEYHRDSMNDGVDVPEGNKLQWLIGSYISVDKHKEFLDKYSFNKNREK